MFSAEKPEKQHPLSVPETPSEPVLHLIQRKKERECKRTLTSVDQKHKDPSHTTYLLKWHF